MSITKIDVKLMKMHEAIERMWIIFSSIAGKRPIATENYLREKERCHELMAEISREVDESSGERMVSVSREEAV